MYSATQKFEEISYFCSVFGKTKHIRYEMYIEKWRSTNSYIKKIHTQLQDTYKTIHLKYRTPYTNANPDFFHGFKVYCF